MNLSFKEYWPDKTRTWFIDKILLGLYKNGIITLFESSNLFGKLFDKFPSEIEEYYKNIDSQPNGKVTSIREDKTNRWKPGNKIHFIINNRTKNRFQFAPVLTVKSTQKIEIKYNKYLELKGVSVIIDGNHKGYYCFEGYDHDNIDLLKTLAQNDGFESIEQFFKWFNKDFSGKIIHWTDLKY
jgi:hypothetical protein